jgi:hypothetical protein
MASYITITDAETDPEAPLTSELAKKWRDNPLSIAEKDTSVPIGLRLGKWLLGTITTTSGSSVSLGSLDLTQWTSLEIIFDQVSATSTSSVLRLAVGGNPIISAVLPSADNVWYGQLNLNLASGVYNSSIARSSSTPSYSAAGGGTGISNLSTSIGFNLNTGSFDDGSILVYGVR